MHRTADDTILEQQRRADDAVTMLRQALTARTEMDAVTQAMIRGAIRTLRGAS